MAHKNDDLAAWIGKTEEQTDIVAAWPLKALGATLDWQDPDPVAGTEIPWPAHWLYFLETAKQSELGTDGHAARGGFLPPVALPRRMWAGGRMNFHAPLKVGDEARKRSTIKNVIRKNGRTGELVFVVVLHEIFGPGGLCISEEHDIVYREEAKPGSREPEPIGRPFEPAWTTEVDPSEALLFRYSALTFNGHRIHYDLDYCRDKEGYPGLVVHGPLTATLLLDIARRNNPGKTMTAFSYRAVRPVFALGPYGIEGAMENASTARVWALDQKGALAMDGTVSFD